MVVGSVETATSIVFCDLLSRLSSAFAMRRQFVADASHELRTPLSVIRTAAAVTLQPAPRSELEYREAD
jgi:signal transduction histidine kinase